jgi:hypothetical protein
LIVTQSAADGLVEELAPVELAAAVVVGADADVAETDADVAAAVGAELDDELDELQPAMRAPLAARTARMVSDEPLGISGTSMGVTQVTPSLAGRPGSLAPDARIDINRITARSAKRCRTDQKATATVVAPIAPPGSPSSPPTAPIQRSPARSSTPP